MGWSCRKRRELRAYVEGGGCMKESGGDAAATYIATYTAYVSSPCLKREPAPLL